MTANGMSRRIGLIATYSGSNLGDGAIQQSMIDNLLKRDASIRCCGITLYPADTRRRHGIPAYPITGLVLPYFSRNETLFSNGDEVSPGSGPPPAAPTGEPKDAAVQAQMTSSLLRTSMDRLRRIKNLPVLGRLLRFVVLQLRKTLVVLVEVRQLARSYGLARQLDLLVVSGSGQLNEEWGGPWGLPYSLFRWSVLAKITRTPLIVVSVGADKAETSLGRFFIRFALGTARYRSYRDVGSRDLVAEWGFKHNDPCVRDLALSLDMTPFASRAVSSAAQTVVAVSPINYGNPLYWPTADPEVYVNYIAALADFVHWLVQRGHQILLFRSGSADRHAIADLKVHLAEKYGKGVLDHLREPEIDRFQDLLTEVSKADFVVASRLHGVILSHLLRKPVVAISFNRKVTAHMEDINQSRYTVNIHTLGFRELRDRFEHLEANATRVRASIDTAIDGWQGDLSDQYEIIIAHAIPRSRLE